MNAETTTHPALTVADGDHAVPLLEGFALPGIRSATTGYKSMKTEPGFHQPFYVGLRGSSLQSEVLAHLTRLAACRDDKVAKS